MRIGIIGLADSGKTTTFNALTRGSVPTGAGGSRGANVGVARVPDDRLAVLAEMHNRSPLVPAEVTYVDLPEAADARGGPFAGEALTHLQRVDALLVVVRAFDDPSVPHPKETVDYQRDITDIAFDVVFADIALLDRRIERITSDMKGARAAERTGMERDIEALKAIQADLEESVPLRGREMSEADRRALQNSFQLSALPFLVAVNIGEEDLGRAAEIEAEAAAQLTGPASGAVALCAQLESELVQMPPEEEAEFRGSLEAGESGLSRMIALSYRVTGLVSFLTIGNDEIRAWSVPAGTPAVTAAGQVHSDIQRGFIRAEVVAYDDLIACGSNAEARKQGMLRSEGREYIVQDGDVIDFLFSV